MGYRICPCAHISQALKYVITPPVRRRLSFYMTCGSMGEIQDVLSP